jgi:hypothetical protein
VKPPLSLPFLAALLLLGLATPAQACWPWCRKGAPSGSAQGLELAVAQPRPQVDTLRTWGVTEVEARTLFEIAYGRQFFVLGKEDSYRSWTRDIGHARRVGGVRQYQVGIKGLSLIVELSSRGTLIVFPSGDSHASDTSGRIGLESDDYAGLLARTLVAVGGRDRIQFFYVFLTPSSQAYAGLADQVGSATQDQMRDYAGLLMEGQLARAFLGFHVYEMYVEWGNIHVGYSADWRTHRWPSVDSRFVRTGLPARVQTDTKADAAPRLQLGTAAIDTPSNSATQESSVKGLDEEEDRKVGDVNVLLD